MDVCVASMSWLLLIVLQWTNIGVYVSFSIIVLFRYMARSGPAESVGNFIFSLLKNLYTEHIYEPETDSQT